MTTIKVKKSPGPVIAAALLAAGGGMIISYFIIDLLAPFGDPRITPAYFWTTVWKEGFLRNCRPGIQVFDLDCRLASLRAWLAWPPFYYRLVLFLCSAAIAATLADPCLEAHLGPGERSHDPGTLAEIRRGRPDLCARSSGRAGHHYRTRSGLRLTCN
jgi:hypothetical protein